jgi:DNA-binding MarR family transcriptional regulator
VVLSAKGEKLARDSAAAAATMESELMTRLSPGEHAMLVELLVKLGG